MKLTSRVIAPGPEPGAWAVESAVLFGATFDASGFVAVGAIGQQIGGNPAEYHVEQRRGHGLRVAAQQQQRQGDMQALSPVVHCRAWYTPAISTAGTGGLSE